MVIKNYTKVINIFPNQNMFEVKVNNVLDARYEFYEDRISDYMNVNVENILNDQPYKNIIEYKTNEKCQEENFVKGKDNIGLGLEEIELLIERAMQNRGGGGGGGRNRGGYRGGNRSGGGGGGRSRHGRNGRSSGGRRDSRNGGQGSRS